MNNSMKYSKLLLKSGVINMDIKHIEKGIVALIRKAETELPIDVINALKKAYATEEGLAKVQIDAILKNIELAKKTSRPMCQDTGIQTFFVTAGIRYPFLAEVEKWIIRAVKKATVEIAINGIL